jgi:WD40 repeat protein
MSDVKSLKRTEPLRLMTFRFPGLLFLSALIISCNPANLTSTATLSPAPVFLPSPYPTSTLPQEDSPTPQIAPSTQTDPTIKFNSWEIVHDLVYSPDGNLLAVAAGNRIHLYHRESLEEIADVQVGAWTNRIAFHPQFQIIILAVKDGTIQFRETLSGELVCQFMAHEKGANSLAINPDGSLLITTGADITSQLWGIASLKNSGCSIDEIGMFIGESFSSPDAAFSPDGNSIALVDHPTSVFEKHLTEN